MLSSMLVDFTAKSPVVQCHSASGRHEDQPARQGYSGGRRHNFRISSGKA